jgi:hypothetical protein
VPHSLTSWTEGARAPIDLSQDGLQVVVAGTSGKVLLRERNLGRKMSPAAFREYNIELLQGNWGHVITSNTFVLFCICVWQKSFSLENPCSKLYLLTGI